MAFNQTSKNLSSVQNFRTGFVVLSFVLATVVANAQSTAPAPAASTTTSTATSSSGTTPAAAAQPPVYVDPTKCNPNSFVGNPDGFKKCVQMQNQLNNLGDCTSLQSSYRTSVTNYNKVCAQLKIGGPDQCNAKVNDCGGSVDDGDADSNESATGPNSDNCPMYSGKDYNTRLDKVNSDIESANKSLADLKQNIADMSEKYNEQTIQAQQDVQQMSSDLQSRTLDREKEVRDDNKNAQLSKDQMQQKIQALQSQNLQLQSTVTQQLASKSEELLAADQNTRKLACIQQVYSSSVYKQTPDSGSFNALQYTSSSKTQTLQAIYSNCMNQLQQKYNDISVKWDSQIQTTQDQIKTNNSQVAQLQSEVQTDQANDAADATAVTTKDSQDQQQTNQKIAIAQQKLNLLYQTTQQKQQAMQQEEGQLQQKIQTLQQSLVSLGKPPANQSSDKDVNDLIDAASDKLQAYHDVLNAGCNDPTKSNSTSDSSSPSTGTASPSAVQ